MADFRMTEQLNELPRPACRKTAQRERQLEVFATWEAALRDHRVKDARLVRVGIHAADLRKARPDLKTASSAAVKSERLSCTHQSRIDRKKTTGSEPKS